MDFSLSLLLVSFIAGIFTILAPCVLPLLPIVVGGSAGERSIKKPLIIAGSLAVSVVVFTLLLKASTALLGVPRSFWTNLSGGILIAFGLISLFPHVWEKFAARFKLNNSSNKLLGKSVQKGGPFGDALIGASLGPVFSSCSPTYAVIIATVLPVNFAVGTVYVSVYALGLGLMLLLIAFAGQRLVSKIGWATDPGGWFKRVIGIIFLAVGLSIITGFDKDIEAWLLQSDFYENLIQFEDNLRE